jgi:hypothetical protein
LPHLALVAPEACEAHGGAEFPGLGLLLTGESALEIRVPFAVLLFCDSNVISPAIRWTSA